MHVQNKNGLLVCDKTAFLPMTKTSNISTIHCSSISTLRMLWTCPNTHTCVLNRLSMQKKKKSIVCNILIEYTLKCPDGTHFS